jgi:hypothetical protein
LKGVSDSEDTGDKDTSVYGYILYFSGSQTTWESKSGKSVTLSSTEAEYFAMYEIADEVIAVTNLWESIGVKLQYPIEIHCDNVGAIF